MRTALSPYYGPEEIKLIEKYLEYGEPSGYEMVLPRERAVEYINEAAQLGFAVLSLDFYKPDRTSMTGWSSVYCTSYYDQKVDEINVKECRRRALEDIDRWPAEAERVGVTLNG